MFKLSAKSLVAVLVGFPVDALKYLEIISFY
jgi:hypothetical protein